MKIKPGRYIFNTNSDPAFERPVITINGSDLDIDFSKVFIQGSQEMESPDHFKGLAVLIENAKRVTLRNLSAKGFKVALMAKQSDSLSIIDCDFSYNYRQRLMSNRERENLSDWLYFHQNEHDEWLRYGAAVYLKLCNHAKVKGLKVTQGQNGLMLVGCHYGEFVENSIQFNSGIGIGMYRSSNNRVLYNRLDWNVRGYSHGIYQRGQDSAGILVYQQSNGNVIAFNSATHSGDGLFLWAGQETMDFGTGGCNSNFIYRNDFSFAPANGVESTFSSNWIIGNIIKECRYGVWAGYSYQTSINENDIDGCDFGIAIEHGNQIQIENNHLQNCNVGIRLWERETQPTDWGFSKNRDVSSREFVISDNTFFGTPEPLQIENTKLVSFGEHDLHLPTLPNVPDPPNDSMHVFLDNHQLQGRQYILMDEWGPFNFEYPSVWLRHTNGNDYVFTLFGPIGNWRLTKAGGFIKGNPESGTFPATFKATRDEGFHLLQLEFEFIGEEHVNRFGDTIPRGSVIPFVYHEFEPMIEWDVHFYSYEPDSLPTKDYDLFKTLIATTPVYREQRKKLSYTWWGSPAEGIRAGKFAVHAIGRGYFDNGNYKIYITSDDGVRLSVNEKIVMERWDFHDPITDMITLPLQGNSKFNIEYFNGGGLGNLDFMVDIHTQE